MLIPRSFIDKESTTSRGFSPELAVVTIAAEKNLRTLVIRPTSEPLSATCGRSGFSPIATAGVDEQWNSVVRWEAADETFPETLEFYWQEGHTAHATREEARRKRARCWISMRILR